MRNVCRTCLTVEEPLHSIHDLVMVNSLYETTLAEMILSFAYIEIQQGDALPEDICQNCIEKTISAYNFKLLCEKSDALLRGAENNKSNNATPTAKSVTSYDIHEDEADHSNENSDHKFEMKTSTNHLNVDESFTKLNLTNYNPQQLNNISTIEVYEVTGDGDLLLLEKEQRESSSHEVENNKFDIIQNPSTDQKDKQFLCALCGKSFNSKSGYKYHFRVHSSSNQSPVKCDLCLNTFTSRKDLQLHKRLECNKSVNTKNPCPECGKMLSSTSLSRHMRTHSSLISSRRTHKCPHCSHSYTRLSYLRVHLYSVHHDPSQSPPKIFPCPHSPCDRFLLTKQSLDIHIKHKHTKERSHKCHLCFKAFITNSGLKEHMRVHSGKKQYTCSICGKHFVTGQSLKFHQRLHTGERPYHCQECGKGFISPSRCSEHYQSKHCKRSYTCQLCGKMFHLHRTLIAHVKIHNQKLNNK